MKKIKNPVLCALALSAIVAGAATLASCSSGEDSSGTTIDYTAYTWKDWSEIPIADWDAKTISYQLTSSTENSERMDLGFGSGAKTQVMLNLYEDGTLALFQAGIYDTGASNAVWYDQALHINWASFGFWEKSADDSTITVYYMSYLAYKQDNTKTVEKSESWAAANEGCFIAKLNKSGDAYVYNPDSDREDYEAIMRFGMNDNGEGMGVDQTLTSTSGTAIVYSTIQSWVNTYINEQPFPQV